MRWLVFAIFCGLSLLALAGERPATFPAASTPAFDTFQRVPWKNERLSGSPTPPLPFRVRRAFPKLTVPCPIGVAREPGSNRLILIHQAAAWSGAGTLLRIPEDEAVTQAEELLKVDGIAYGIAFHPNYARNGYLYVGLNGPMNARKKTRVLRYTVDRRPPHRLVPQSERLIIEWDSDGHNGGDLAFGPDGMLYISSGDGTSDSDTNLAGQDLTRLLAKVLRIDVDNATAERPYAVPKDNPFVGQPGIVPETWAYGFRNPWRLHVDRETGDVWVGNNGQDLWEQVYLVQKGANYGWSVLEGSHPFYQGRKAGPHPFSKPIAEHHHSEARSLTGGVVYRGQKFPELRGAYLYGDWSTGKIWGLKHRAGKVVWHQELADTTLQITGFGVDSQGEVLIADHGSGYYRLERSPAENQSRFPTRLSDTGLFTSVQGHATHPGLIPYTVNAPLWSDGAHKERFLALPGNETIDPLPNRGWNFPDGTVLVKSFALDTDAGQAASRRWIETRLMVKQEGEWTGYSYEWQDDQKDAVLVDSAGRDRTFSIRDARAPGGQRRQTWHYPSRAECMVCHSRAANFVLGLCTLQLNREHDYGGGVSANQLRVLERLGTLRVPVSTVLDETKKELALWRTLALRPLERTWPRLGTTVDRSLETLETQMRARGGMVSQMPRSPSRQGRLVDPADPRQSLEARARSYLHANCSSCHVEAGGGNSLIDLEFTTPRERMRLIGIKPNHDTLGLREGKLIEPGQPEKSVLYQRISRRGPGQMPPLATAEVDQATVQLFHDWIQALKP